MEPSKINEILDLAYSIRKSGGVYNPLFVSPPGIGKSEIVQAWCKRKNIPFIDIRAAYMESPDLIGFPSISERNGRQTTVHNIPEFWPYDGEGVIFLDEINRGTTSVLNTFMQLLTDRKIHKHSIPDGWIVVSCINPETAENDVTTMDSALKNRFEIFNVNYDKKTFLSYMKEQNWHQDVQMFVESTWQYKTPEEIGDAPGVKYVSPRTFAKLNAILQNSNNKELEMTLYESQLGANLGRDFYSFRNNESPVLYKHLVEDFKKSAARLKKFSDPKNYKNGMIYITVKDIIENNEITNELLAKVLDIIPVDQGISLVNELEFKRKDDTLLEKLFKDFPAVKAMFKDVVRAK